MISRLEFPDGIDMPRDQATFQSEVVGLMVASMADIELLPTGVYDITPRLWTKHTHNHELTVLDNGEGLYRIFPRENGVGFLEADAEAGLTDFKPGGRSNPVNAYQPLAVVAGGHPRKQGLFIFNLIAHLQS